eukprot:TRINITY_DN9525_c0_g1_i2.p2 TRINITY_DN9525_c0_g1~~TRINITY_DN9525_c0_g1_i2.p2  ORF type:complete len:101 (-),score=14.40 TRINITY_DN9525_c0_g1_i2:52-354(-)
MCIRDRHKVMVYSLANCPYCVKAKDLLTRMKVDFHQIECNRVRVRQAQIQQLHQIANMKTFPKIFVDAQILGGYSELKQMQENGELQKLFDQKNIKYVKI